MTLVSGPDAVFRLKNKEGKVIYLFGESHNPLNLQNECPISEDSLRIDQLLKKCFKKNKNTKLAFYLETSPSFIPFYGHKGALRQYIESLRSLFSDNVSFNEKNKIQKSIKFPNVMFHFFDIRDEDCLKNGYDLGSKSANLSNYQYLLSTTIFFTSCVLNDKKLYYMSKIKTKPYRNSKIKESIMKIYNQNVNMMKDVRTEAIKLSSISKKIVDNFHENKLKMSSDKRYEELNKIFSPIENFGLKTLNAGAIFCDLFLMRRLLDKNYETKINYIYSGLFHTVNILLFLLNYSDFELTHSTSVSPYIEKHFKKYSVEWLSDNFDEIMVHITGLSEFEERTQCVDLKSFPKYLR